MRNVVAALLIASGVACASSSSNQASAPRPKKPVIPAGLENCPPMPEKPLRYADVEFAFNNHCARCHTRAYDHNEGAQRVFESTTYPFTTEEPERLGRTMVEQWRTRRGVEEEERCIALTWWYGGALDNEGNPPPWPMK